MSTTDKFATMMFMVSKSATVAAMAKATGLTRQTLYKKLRALEQAKVARIADWKRDETGRAVEPVWELGDEPSVPKRRLSNADKQREYRQRQAKGKKVMQAMAMTMARDVEVKADAVQK